MSEARKIFALILFFVLLSASASMRAQAQVGGAVYHQLEGRIQHSTGRIGSLRVRLLRMPDMRPVGETFSRPEGQFAFSFLIEGEYIVETFETEKFARTETKVSIRPMIRARSQTFHVVVEVASKAATAARVAPGVIAADVDLNVPKAAQKHYRAGMKAIERGDAARGVEELRASIVAHPKYYAARLELGRELRAQKRFQEALDALQPLGEIAPKRAEAHVENGIVLFALGRIDEATERLQAALELEENNCAAHLYLGWAWLEKDAEKASAHFKRALELDEQKAARAHLSLARIADAKGQRQLAIQHLDAYLALTPDAPDAEAVRKLAARLRTPN